MLNERELSAAIGSTVYDTDGDKIGTVEHFFADDRTGTPTWVAVMTGLFGTRQSIAPAVDATFDDGSLRLPVSKEAVKSAPHMAGEHLDPAEEAALREHYGLGTAGLNTPGLASAGVNDPGLGTPAGTVRDGGRHAAPAAGDQTADWRTDTVVAGTVERDETDDVAETPSPSTRDTAAADGAMTRSEEQLRVGTERVATTRARLVKYVVTEEVQITVPIRREEIRVEQVPIDAPDDGPGESLVEAGEASPSGGPSVSATGGGGLPEEIVLHTERPVVTVEVVPVERVRLRTEVVQGQETVTEQVQREQIAVDENRMAPRTS